MKEFVAKSIYKNSISIQGTVKVSFLFILLLISPISYFNMSRGTSELITNFTHIWGGKLLMVNDKVMLMVSLYKNQ